MDDLKNIISEYDIGEIIELKAHGGTAGKTWTLKTSQGQFFLRKRGFLTAGKALVEFDHHLRRELVKNNFPTLAPLTAKNGKSALYQGEECYEMYEFIKNGRTHSVTNHKIIENCASALASMHRIGEALLNQGRKLPLVSQYNFPGHREVSERLDDPELLNKLYKWFISTLRAEEKAQYARQIESAQRIIEKLCVEYAQSFYAKLPQTIIHGDFTLANILFDDDFNITGVFDFDWSRPEVRLRDIADSLYFIAGRRRSPMLSGDIWSLTETVDLDVGNCQSFLQSYNQINPLSEPELELIPLAFAGRWLSIRLQGSAKVDPGERARFCFEPLIEPIQWFKANHKNITP